MIYNVQAHLNPRWRLVIEMHVLRFGNKLNEEVCRGFISYLFNFQDLVIKVKNLVALAPVLGAISRPAIY